MSIKAAVGDIGKNLSCPIPPGRSDTRLAVIVPASRANTAGAAGRTCVAHVESIAPAIARAGCVVSASWERGSGSPLGRPSTGLMRSLRCLGYRWLRLIADSLPGRSPADSSAHVAIDVVGMGDARACRAFRQRICRFIKEASCIAISLPRRRSSTTRVSTN